MAIRFYLDADLLGLAKLLVSVRADVTYPGDPGGVGVDGVTRPPVSDPAGGEGPRLGPARRRIRLGGGHPGPPHPASTGRTEGADRE